MGETTDRLRYEVWLVRTLDRVEEMKDADEHEVWGRTAEALGWLYRFEEWERKADTGYYEHRNASPEGRTLAALLWMRAAVDHDGHGVREQVFQVENLLLDGSLLLLDGSPLTIRTPSWVWPERLGPADKHQRHVHYAHEVAGQPVMAPLRRAASYLLDVRSGDD